MGIFIEIYEIKINSLEITNIINIITIKFVFIIYTDDIIKINILDVNNINK